MAEDPIVISSTIQEFLGRRYYRCGRYFQDAGKRLHRAVWEHHRGQIPKGLDVHHKDEDRHNNRIGNLELMSRSKHMEHHMKSEDRRASAREAIKIASKSAAEWHGSDEGRAWHKLHWEDVRDKLFRKVAATCVVCGTGYEATDNGSEQKYCSKNCKAKDRYRSGIDNEERSCAFCGQTFSVNKYYKTQTCSKSCAAKARWVARRE